MYKNIFFHRESGDIHLWDEEEGYTCFPYKKSAFKVIDKPVAGKKYTLHSLHGQPVKVVSSWKKREYLLNEVIEADVRPEVRVLTNVYLNEDLPPTTLDVLYFDIEVDTTEGFHKPYSPDGAITAIAWKRKSSPEYVCALLDLTKDFDRTPFTRTIPSAGGDYDATVHTFSTESELLMFFLIDYKQNIPDIITGWNIEGYDVPYLINRCKKVLQGDYFSYLSPINIVEWDKRLERYNIAGITQLDYMLLYKDKKFIPSSKQSYALNAVSLDELKEGKITYTGSLDELYANDPEKFIEYNVHDVTLVERLDKKLDLINLAVSVCCKGHVPFEDIYWSTRFLDGACLIALHRNNLVGPNRPFNEDDELLRYQILREMAEEENERGDVDYFEEYENASTSSKKLKSTLSSPDLDEEFDVLSVESKIFEKRDVAVQIAMVQKEEKELDAQEDGNGLFTITTVKHQSVAEFKKEKAGITTLPKANSKDDKFQGAFVKAPVPGLYHWVFDLDLESLYPSVIRTLNISPETKRPTPKGLKGDALLQYAKQNNYSLSLRGILYDKTKRGFIPSLFDTWTAERKHYKSLKEEAAKRGDKVGTAKYDLLQKVTKVVNNSLYGASGQSRFRFYDLENAESTTLTGQMVVKASMEKVNEFMNVKVGTTENPKDYVVYVDTDSNFIVAHDYLVKQGLTTPKEKEKATFELAVECENLINDYFQSKEFVAKMNVDKTNFIIKQEYIAMNALWVAKKMYAQLIISDKGISIQTLKGKPWELDVKGLALVRSTCPNIAKTLFHDTLVAILLGESKKSCYERLDQFKKNLRTSNLLEAAIPIGVNLSKYPLNADGSFKKGSPAHVKAALSFNKMIKILGNNQVLPIGDGEKIKYVVLKRENPYRFESLACRGNDDPDEVIDYMIRWVDYEKLYINIVHKKIEGIFTAIGWKSSQAEENSVFNALFS